MNCVAETILDKDFKSGTIKSGENVDLWATATAHGIISQPVACRTAGARQ